MAILIQKEFDTDYFNFLQKEANRVPNIDPNTSICFTDIDGVLNSKKFMNKNQHLKFHEMFDPDAISRLNKIIERTGAKIVISSSKRENYINIQNGFVQLVNYLSAYGIKNVVGMTPHLRGQKRCEEIKLWLKEHPIKSFVILDDDLNANVSNRQVKTLFENGLLDKDIDEAVKILETAL